MSTLVILIPPRERAPAPEAGADAPSDDYRFVLTHNGVAIAAQGSEAASRLPRADSVVAVLPEGDVSWHRIPLPKAPAARLRAALAGVLEEDLLDEPERLHLALEPGASANQPAWIAAMDKAWIAGHLGRLERAGAAVDRLVPMVWPDAAASGHFWDAPGEAAGAPIGLSWADANGVVSVRLQGGLAHALLPQWTAQHARWSASAAVAAPAERWLGAPVVVISDEQRALQAARSLWNLRQFDLAPRRRGTRVLRDAARQFFSPGWRPVRWGLVGLVAVQLLGLNLWAWHQRGEIKQREADMVAVLRAAHPQVRAVLDAPSQMQRETDLLRAAAGKPGETDLEPMLSAAAGAWPEELPPMASLRFEPGKLTMPANGWTPPQIEQFRQRLRPGGWRIDANGGALVMTRAAPGGAT